MFRSWNFVSRSSVLLYIFTRYGIILGKGIGRIGVFGPERSASLQFFRTTPHVEIPRHIFLGMMGSSSTNRYHHFLLLHSLLTTTTCSFFFASADRVWSHHQMKREKTEFHLLCRAATKPPASTRPDPTASPATPRHRSPFKNTPSAFSVLMEKSFCVVVLTL